MKRKQLVLEKIEDMDNLMVSTWQALQVPNVSKEAIQNYLQRVRTQLHEIQNFVKLEDSIGQ